MRTASLGDVHLRLKAPVGRIDNFSEALWRKLAFMVSYCNENKIRVMFLPGDIFDSVNASNKVLVKAFLILKEFEGTIFAVYGNHDLKNWNMKTADETPLGYLKELLPSLIMVGAEPYEYRGHHIYGVNWNEDIPEVEPGSKSILLIHKMIIDEKLWPGQKVEGDGKGINLLRKTNYDLIVSGDNHQQFVLTTGDKRHLINSGSMMRTTIKQIDATPGFYVYDTKTKKRPKRVDFPITEDAFDIEKLEALQVKNDKLDDFTAFIEVISKGRSGESVSFTGVYNDLLKQTEDADLIEYSNELFKEV